MEPISLSAAVLSVAGGGRVSMWRGSGTVRPGCPLLVDALSWAACCRPDVETHLQLAGSEADKPGLLDPQTAG